MSSYAPNYYSTSSGALPIPAVPSSGKNHYGHHHHQHGQYHQGYYPVSGNESTYSVSPPEDPLDRSSVSGSSTSGGSSGMMPSYSVTASSYAGSINQGDYYHNSSASSGSASGMGLGGIDMNDYMADRFAERFDPLPLDKCTAKQAQTSGHLNAKHRELLELQAKAQARLAKTRARFAQGLEDAREVRDDLEWTQKKLSSLSAKASKKHSKEYTKARQRYPSPPTF
ncbi:biogenesis of lysosome-related organelles complex 1 subunit KXD1 [Cladorrhinum sp. PSN259]|nr:biogenesis of lysosome-related organelles complex 1 subunit KXD1 [Cladorrhinum sp. PSN259]